MIMTKLSKKEAGFSLMELLIVVAMIGIIASISVTAFVDAKTSAGKSSAVAQLRSMYSAQQNYHIQNLRFADITELAAAQNGGYGTVSANKLTNGRYTYQMSPLTPTPAELSQNFTMESNGYDNAQTIKFVITERGNIVQTNPVLKNW
jgi:prepilin-type N-terminal cleavage/methylation domain-containing protein